MDDLIDRIGRRLGAVGQRPVDAVQPALQFSRGAALRAGRRRSPPPCTGR